MKQIVQFHIEKGEDYYIAQGVDLPIVTQAKTLDELTDNIREAVDLALEGEDLKELGFLGTPSLLANFEIPRMNHA